MAALRRVSTPDWPAGFGMSRAIIAALSNRGYYVFLPNPRGSYGQGEDFTRANVKDFGGGDLRDTLAGIDAALKKYPIDPARLGVTGWSYGGFMTMWTVTQTNRFHAAVAGAGIANWQSYYGQNLIDQWMIPFFGASVYDDPAVYAKSSPIQFIKQVKTPTLVIVGEHDAECPAPQSHEFWHALKTLGVPTKLIVYPGEGHMFVKPENQVDRLEQTVAWFDKYLTAGESDRALTMNPIQISSEGGRQINVLGIPMVIRIHGRDTGGAIAVVESHDVPGCGPPPHIHYREDETFQVLEGEYEWTVGGETFVARKGATIFAPREMPHTYRYLSETPGRLMCVITPSGFEEISARVAFRSPKTCSAALSSPLMTRLGLSSTMN